MSEVLKYAGGDRRFQRAKCNQFGKIFAGRRIRNRVRGAKGIDTCAREYAISNGIKLTEFLPEYEKYGRSAPLKRNITIIENADLVLAFWDGTSRGTKFVVDECKSRGIPVQVFVLTNCG